LLAGVLIAVFTILFLIPNQRLPFARRSLSLAFNLRMAVMTALVAGLLVIQPGWSAFPVLFFLLAVHAMMDLEMPGGLIWVAVFTLITAIVSVATEGIIGLLTMLPYAAGYLFFASFGWVLIQAEENRRKSEELLGELQAAHRQLQQYAAQVEELTTASERNRIAREMHDTLGHRLTIAAVQLEGAQRLIPTAPERAIQIVGTVREQVKEGLGELRRTVAMLRASVDEDLPLPLAVTRLVEQVHNATGLQIHLQIEECPKNLPLPQRQALFRAAQEGLTNIQRHAQAREAWVQLSQRDGQITLLVGDNGAGLPTGPLPGGFGLTGLRERAALLGGEFHVDPRAGGGTQLTFHIPLPEETYAEPS
jgi:signal transduction histidine kinase